MVPGDSMAANLYGDLAEYYDLIYHWKDYAAEANRIRAILSEHSVSDGATLVDVACGTGSHLHHLSKWYSVFGADLNPAMLDLARRKVPGARFRLGNMAAGPAFSPADAILCLFSAFGYLLSDADIDRTIAGFVAGLVPGGVLILEPWVDPASFRPGTAAMHTHDSPDLKLCRSVVTRREDPDISVLEFHWLIAAAGSPRVIHEIEEHRLRLLSTDQLLGKLTSAGLRSTFVHKGLTDDRGIIISVRE